MSNTIMSAKNSFSEGLLMDFSPENSGANSLTSALNATFVTFNGNEGSLQNDMGNGRVETACLPEGYIPVGSCEFGDIVYIVSYNPLINKSQIGCFPSPERNISSEELGILPTTISSNEFQILDKENNPTGSLKSSSVKKIIFNNDMHPGDQYVIYAENTSWNDYVSDYGNSDHQIEQFPKLVKINVVSIEESGKITYLNSNVKWYDNDYYILNGINKNEEDKIDLDSYKTMTNSAYSTFASKVSGKLALLIELEKITGFSCSWDCYLPKEKEYTAWIYTGINNILDTDGKTLSDSKLYAQYGNSDLLWTTNEFTEGDKLYEINYDQELNGKIPHKGVDAIITKKYDETTTYKIPLDIVEIQINPIILNCIKCNKGDTWIYKYDDQGNLKTPPEELIIENDLLISSGSNGYQIYTKTEFTTDCKDGYGNVNKGILYLPFPDSYAKGEQPLEKETDEENINYALSKYYHRYKNTKFTISDDSYIYMSSNNQISGCWLLENGMFGTPVENFKIQVSNKYENIIPRYNFIVHNDKIYKQSRYSVMLKNIEKYNDLLLKSVPIYFNFNWITENKNINPKYALLEELGWKNDGIFNCYKRNDSGDIEEYNQNITAYNSVQSNKFWNFTRGYKPEEHSYSQFKTLWNYETYANRIIDDLKKIDGKTVFSSIKSINKSIDQDYNVPENGKYYINATSWELQNGKIKYISIQDRENENILEIPTKIITEKKEINDDIVNNTFKYPISKHFNTFKIPIQQEIENELIDIDQSNFVYQYKVIPAMPYGKLDEFAVTGIIDFSKIGKTDIKLKNWKYYNNDNKTILTWALDAYTEPDKGIPEVIFEFYDNQGLAAAYHVANYASFNGQFTNYLSLNDSNGTPGLNNIDWQGNEFFHLKNQINRNDASLDKVYYYKTEENKYEKVNDLTKLNNNIKELYESDAGTLYSNWLYGVKIIVRYEFKNVIGDYIKNESPIIEYRWLWTNTLFNDYYYTNDDFTNLQFSLNLDMNVNYSIIKENWELDTNTYQNKLASGEKLANDELRGATVQSINCDRTKDNINLKVIPGLINTYNTFTLCSEIIDEQNIEYPLKNIHAEIILADQQLQNYPEQPELKQYSSGMQESELQQLLPTNTTNLTGTPTYVGKELSKLLRINSTAEALDIFEQDADLSKFENNVSIYNRSFVNKSLIEELNFNIGLSNFGIYTQPKLKIALNPDISDKPLINENNTILNDGVLDFKEQDGNHNMSTGTRYRYFTSKDIINFPEEFLKDLNSELSFTSIANIQQDINSTENINITINDIIYYLSSTLITQGEYYVYKIGRNYQNKDGIYSDDNTYDSIERIYEPLKETFEYDEVLYCYSNNAETFSEYDKIISENPEGDYITLPNSKYIQLVSYSDQLTNYLYKFTYNGTVYKKSTNNINSIASGEFIIDGGNYHVRINNELTQTYTRNEVLLNDGGSELIIPDVCLVNPRKLNDIIKKYTFTKDIEYIVDCSKDSILYYLTSLDPFTNPESIKDDNYNDYDRFFLNKINISTDNKLELAINWESKLKIFPNQVLKFDENTTLYLIVQKKVDSDITSAKVEIYEKNSSFVEQKFSYFNNENVLKELDSYHSYKFESDINNLHTLSTEGFNLALSGVHFSKFKLQSELIKDYEVGVVRPYIYFVSDLKYNNLQLLDNNNISFMKMFFFSMDNESGLDTRIMGTIHEITGYKQDTLNTKEAKRLGYIKSGNGDVNLSYTKINNWQEHFWSEGIKNFYPVGWGKLATQDNTMIKQFTRGNTKVTLMGMNGTTQTGVSSTSTLGIFINKNNEKTLQFSDDWKEKGVQQNARNVLSLLTQLYYLQDTKEKTEVQRIFNYGYLSNNYTLYTRDIAVILKPKENIDNCNSVITFHGMKYQEFVDQIVTNIGVDISRDNVTCQLDSIMKIVPISFRFDYIIPTITLNTNPEFYKMYKVDLPPNKPYCIVEGQKLQYNTPYVVNNNGILQECYSSKTFSSMDNAIISTDSQGGLVNEDKGGEIDRLYITNLGYNRYFNLNNNLKHHHEENKPPIITLVGGLSSQKDWSIPSTKNGTGNKAKTLYITGLPGKSIAGKLKYFE